MTGYIHNFMLVKLNASAGMLESFDEFMSRDLIKVMFETINDFEFPDTIDTINEQVDSKPDKLLINLE